MTAQRNKPITLLIAGLVIGLGIGATLMWYFGAANPQKSESNAGQAKPLYWVAPMDANFRRDQPGKSPMGMDLIPVYEESGDEDSPGTVRISPNVVNNLGVRTQVARKEILSLPIKTVGYVQYNQDKLIHIHPRAEGWVDTMFVKSEGEQVKENQPLYTLYSPQLVNAQEEYLLAASRNNAVLKNAALGRLKALQMPQQAIEQLQKTNQVLQSITFFAPQSGVIDNLNIREGFFVKPDKTLMSIAALDDVWVETEVFERMAGQVKVGQLVTMTLDYLPGKSWQGIVDYIYPNLNESTRTLRARLRFDNQDRQLKPNMFAQVVIHVIDAEPSIVVPKEAVIRTGVQDRVVLALGGGAFKSIEVQLGMVRAGRAQIFSGVQEGDMIVTSAQFLLDSESSIHSDFLRMSEINNEPDVDAQGIQSATVNGVVNRINKTSKTVNISREGIEKWGRGPATLDFMVDEVINLDTIGVGQSVLFTFEIINGDFVITEITATAQRGAKTDD